MVREIDKIKAFCDVSVPVLQFRDPAPLDDYYVDENGDYYGVARLIELSKEIPEFWMPIAGMDLSCQIWKGCNIYELAFHVKKVENADLSFPIILDWNGAIADGRHRLIRAIIDGKKHIAAKRLLRKPEPCRWYNPDSEE